ncbi:MAG TPA: flavin reductase [Planctomycetota bacterium]|nr:flavin reductase [Planctomycetota bacterium]
MLIDPSALDPRELYRLMISIIVPRPIAWTSTISADGVLNAAPFSYFQALSSNPPTVMISVGRRRGGVAKDTRKNIEATREFVVNIVSEGSGVRMVRTSVDYPAEVSEFAEAGLTPVRSEKVKPPRIGESAVSLECRLDRVLEIGTSGICIGEIVAIHVRDDVLAADGTVDPWKLRPLGRLGGASYAPLREVAEITTDGGARTAQSELLDTWRDLRRATVALAGRLGPEQLAQRAGDGPAAGTLLLHLAQATARLAGGAAEDRAWDPRWTPERIREELERTGREFEEAARVFTPDARGKVRLAIRHEAWHQGQLAAMLRAHFASGEIWAL